MQHRLFFFYLCASTYLFRDVSRSFSHYFVYHLYLETSNLIIKLNVKNVIEFIITILEEIKIILQYGKGRHYYFYIDLSVRYCTPALDCGNFGTSLLPFLYINSVF